MSSPTNSEQKDLTFPDENPSLTTQDEEKQQSEDQNPPQSQNPQSPKPITLEIPDADEPNPIDPNQADRDEVTAISPTITSPTLLTFSRRGFGGGGGKRKKRNVLQEKRSQLKLETLSGILNLIPFKPVKTLDLTSHEALLRRLGLWDFAHLDFDFKLNRDLILQLIANFSPSVRGSKVNEVRIKVSRADLARALFLPVKKDKVDSAMEVKESEESVSFVFEFVSNFMLLHEDTWMMSDEVCNTMNLIKEGSFEKVDFPKLIWLMVERELSNAESLGNCYYASHLQLLIKSQKEDILLKVQQEPVRMEIDLQEDEEEEVKKIEEEHHRGSELEEYNFELSLGGPDNSGKNDGIVEVNEKELGIPETNEKEQFIMETNEKEQFIMETNEKEQFIVENIESEEQSEDDDNDAMDFEESKEDEQGQWPNTSMDGHYLQRCNFDDVEFEEERKPDEEEEEEEEGKDSEYEEDKEEEEEMHFSLSPNCIGLEGASSENLLLAIEASQNPFSSGMQNHEIPGGSSLFHNGNGSKRVIGHLENDNIPNHGGNKRMRSDGHWENMKETSEFDIYVEQMEHVMGKARMSYEAKDQAYQNLSMQHQMLLGEFEHRNDMIHNLHKAKMEEQQRRQTETYRLEHELNMMSNLLEGYRKALKQTTKEFAEYRKKCPIPEEPIYKDTGSGGLVLSTSELEKLRLKQEEEERQCRLVIEKMIKEFEAHWASKFEGCESYAETMFKRLGEVEKEVNLCKEGIAKRKKGVEISESAPLEEEQVAQQSV